MKQSVLENILADIESVNITVYGDFCLDAYWILDPGGGEISVETGLKSEAVRRQYYTLGGASNVVANLAALKPKKINVVGVIGCDIFGREMLNQFDRLGVNTEGIVHQDEGYDTVVFAKRYLNQEEQPRIDFGFFNNRTPQTDATILDKLRARLSDSDALIFNQQVPGSIKPSFIEGANALFRDFSELPVLLDTRHFGKYFEQIIRKTNYAEAAELLDRKPHDEPDHAELEFISRTLWQQFKKPVFLTLGANGIISVDAHGIQHTPSIAFDKQLDPVGAGDTVISALAAAIAAGYDPHTAAEFANLAAGVTVQKLYMTGTASPQELLDLNGSAKFSGKMQF